VNPKTRWLEGEAAWRAGLLAVLALATVLAFWGLAEGGLRDGDEARYALVAENMLHQPDPWTMYYQGQPYFWKSPLRIWMTAMTFKVAGITPWTVRIWSAVAGVLTVWLTCLLGRNLYGRWGGLLAGLAVATMPGFLHVHGARTGEMDTALAAFLLLALLPLTRPPRRGDLIPSAAALAGCGLVKHLTLVPVGGLMLVAGYVLDGRWRALRWREVLTAAGVLLALLAPWFIIQAIAHPQALSHAYFGSVIGQTTVSSPDPDPGPGFFAGVLLSGAWPWSGLFIAGIVLLVLDRKRSRHDLLPLLWMGIYLLIISTAQRKLPWYALPAYPLMALALGAAATVWWRRARSAGGVLGMGMLAGLVTLVWMIGPHTAGFAQRPGFKVVMDGSFLATGMAGWRGPLVLILAGCGSGLAFLASRSPRGSRIQDLVVSLGLALLALMAIGSSWVPLQHPYPGDWDLLLHEVRDAGYGQDQVMVVMPEARWRDDVRNFYVRRLSGPTGEFTLPEAGVRLRQGRYNGVLVTHRESLRQLEAYLKREAPGAHLGLFGKAGDLVILKIGG